MSVMSDILEGRIKSTPEGLARLAELQRTWPKPNANGRVFLLHLNYAILGVFKSEESAQAEADAFMVLHAGVWTKTSPQMLQWFNHGVGHVEIVGHYVQG